jgi:hypothetical protein
LASTLRLPGTDLREKHFPKMSKKLFTIALAAALLPLACFANDAPTDAPAVPSEEPAKPPDSADWWQKSSFAFSPTLTRFLFHVDGTLSYMNAQGNTSGNSFYGASSFEVRKQRWTNRFVAELTHKNLVYGFGGGSVDFTENTLREELERDLNKRLLVVAGIEDYRNTMIFIDKRLTSYGGLGAEVFKNERQQVNLVGGLGFVNFGFDEAAMLRVNPAETATLPGFAPSTGGGMGREEWRWRLPREITLTQSASYMKLFRSSLGHLWTLGLVGDIPFAKKLSIAIAYRINDEDNIYIDALQVKVQDRTFTTGIKISM